jgi:hypothetical protein
VRRSNCEPGGDGDQLTVQATGSSATEALFHVLAADPKVINGEARAAADAQERLTQHLAEQEEARCADRVAQLGPRWLSRRNASSSWSAGKQLTRSIDTP